MVAGVFRTHDKALECTTSEEMSGVRAGVQASDRVGFFPLAVSGGRAVCDAFLTSIYANVRVHLRRRDVRAWAWTR